MTPALWTGMFAELSLPAAFRALNALGWSAFEISTEHLVRIETDPNPDSLIDAARAALREQGLDAPQAHAFLTADVAQSDPAMREQDIRRLIRHIEISARLGVRQVVIHPGGRRGRPAEERDAIRALNVEAFRRLGDIAGEQGVRIGLENLVHPGTITATDLLDLLERIGHSAIGITLDTSHANMSGLDVAQMVRDLSPHLIATHISDNDGSGDQHLTPGNGKIHWPSVMTAFREVNYAGLFNLEIPGERHAVLELRQLKIRHAREVARWLVGPG